MARYYVVATLGTTTVSQPLDADNESEATIEAVLYIMDKAWVTPDGPWARGEIELIDKGTTKVLRTMKGKE